MLRIESILGHFLMQILGVLISILLLVLYTHHIDIQNGNEIRIISKNVYVNYIFVFIQRSQL